MFLDEDNRQEIATDILPVDTLKFKDTKRYSDRLKDARDKTNETDALIVIEGFIYTEPVVIAVFEFNFIGGSMGSVVGEKFTQGVKKAAIRKMCPFICVVTSGGARMQEGVLVLMQMLDT